VQGQRWLTYTSAAPGSDEAEKRLRGRKITPKRGGREDRRRKFSECCNRHEWGLIDGAPLPPCGRRRLQLAGRNFTNFHYAPSRASGNASARSRLLAHAANARPRTRAHSGITNYSLGNGGELRGSDINGGVIRCRRF